MKKFYFIIYLIIVSLFILPYKGQATDSGVEELKLFMGEVKMVSVDSPKRIIIGNPGVVDVARVTKNEVALSPKAVGTTTLVIWDNFGELSYKVRVFTEDVQELKGRIDNLLKQLNLPGVYTKVDEIEGRVLLLGSIKCPSECSTKPSSSCSTNSSSDSSAKSPSDSSAKSCPDRERINAILGPLKDKIIDLIQVKEEEAVVEIDVQVLELDKDATKNLGFSWPGTLGFLERGTEGVSNTGAKWGKLFKLSSWQRTAFLWSIDALIQEGKARILSRPRLACQSGKEAELLVGGERPVLTSEVIAASGIASTSVSYKEFGIKLKIKPVVMEDRRIKIALNMEVSEIGDAIVIGTVEQPTAKAWPLTKRNASTELILDDQQTLAIGGLIKRKDEEDIRKTPFLGDLPVLGALFRKKLTKVGGGAESRGDTELFITLTPTIVSGKEEAGVSPPKEGTRGPEISSSQVSLELPQELAGYAQVIQKRILQNLTYPASAKDAGFQGTIRLSLHLSYKGELLDAVVKDSSGYKLLDDDAIAVVKGIPSYPPFPPTIGSKDLWIDIPIEYRLN